MPLAARSAQLKGVTPDEVVRVGDQFYVLAESSRADDRTRVLKQDDTFGVFDRQGDIQPTGLGEQGLYHEGTRFLSRLELLLAGVRPLLLSSNVDERNLSLVVDMANPDLSDGDEIVAQRGTIHLLRSRVLCQAVLCDRIAIRNFGQSDLTLPLQIRFDADFADIFEIRGIHRSKHGRRLPSRVEDGVVTLGYRGLDGITRNTRISCDGDHVQLQDGAIALEISVPALQGVVIELRVCCETSEEVVEPLDFETAYDRAKTRLDSRRERECDITTSNEHFNHWLQRSRADLGLMITHTKHGPYPHAGLPWYATPFGRDGIITALQTLWLDADLARGVLSLLSATQADVSDPDMDAQPGKIVHELRSGEMAATGEVPFARYYGSVDSTPLFVILAGEYLQCTNDAEFIRSIWPNIERALNWIDRSGDIDGDGFVEYESTSKGGLNNQGWKDSRDSIFHRDGTLASPPIALCEVQAYVYAARRHAATVARSLGHDDLATDQERRADALRRNFMERFWDDEMGLFVLALDGDKKPCRVAASNAGQCLFSGIASEAHAQRIARALTRPEFFSGWGVRTLAEHEPRYNPMSYHNGSIWPHDNSLIAWGMARYGHAAEATRLLGGLLDLSMAVEQYRLPELLCGFRRRPGEGPVGYPLTCSPQAWAAGAVFLTLQACLGLEIRADLGELWFRSPSLPEFLQFVQIRNLRVGAGSVDLALHRHPNDVAVTIQRQTSGVRVVVTN